MINLITPMLSASFYGRMARKQYIAGQFTSHFPFLEGVAGLGPFCLWWLISFVQANGYGSPLSFVVRDCLPFLFMCLWRTARTTLFVATVRLALPRFPHPTLLPAPCQSPRVGIVSVPRSLAKPGIRGWLGKNPIVRWLDMGVQHVQPSKFDVFFP